MTIVCATDERYAPLLAGMLASLTAAGGDVRPHRLLVLERGLGREARSRIGSMTGGRFLSSAWVSLAEREPLRSRGVPEAFFALPGSGHYDRLLIPFLVPEDESAALYLDCDLMVLDSLEAL